MYFSLRFNDRAGIDFVRCRICDDRRRVISGRHLSKHGTDREKYMDEYDLSPDELIAKDSRRLHSSRSDYRPYSKRDWMAAIKKVYKRDEQVFAGFLQEKHQQLYHQGIWLFGDWDKALRAAGFDPEQMRLRSFWNGEKVILGIRAFLERGEGYLRNTRLAKAKSTSLSQLRDEKSSKPVFGSATSIRIMG